MRRLVFEAGLIFIYSSTVLLVSIYLMDRFIPGIEIELIQVPMYLALTLAVTFMITSIYEGAFLFDKWKSSLIESERLQRENLQSQYETLKNQVNPHFLFNSLNALSSLVHLDPDKAVDFIDEFSKIYRYVLDTRERAVVQVKEEMAFVNSFMFLQKIRFGDNLRMEVNVAAEQLNDYVPPLSLQLLFENAIKHNEISSQKPLNIELFNENGYLVVKNNLQLREDGSPSTGLGLNNLKDRYSMISSQETHFFVSNGDYLAKIPLIKEE